MKEDKVLVKFLDSCKIGMFFLSDWIQTWFSHVLANNRNVERLFDIFIATDYRLPIYFATSILLYHRNQVLETEDMATIFRKLRTILEDANQSYFEILLKMALDLMAKYPPDALTTKPILLESMEILRQVLDSPVIKHSSSRSTTFDKSLSSLKNSSLIEFADSPSETELINSSIRIESLIKCKEANIDDLISRLDDNISILFDAAGSPNKTTSEILLSNFVFNTLAYVAWNFKKEYSINELMVFSEMTVKSPTGVGGKADYAICDSNTYNINNVICFIECKISDCYDGLKQSIGYLSIQKSIESEEKKSDRKFYALSFSGTDWCALSLDKKYQLYEKERFISVSSIRNRSQFKDYPLLIKTLYQILLNHFKLSVKQSLKRSLSESISDQKI